MISQAKLSNIVSIEGNIGSGKSTLLKYLRLKYKENKNIVFVDEPVEDWDHVKDLQGTTMLQLFYQDQQKHAFAFQMMAFISRLSKLKDAIEKNPNSIIITERSLYTDKMVFAQMLKDSGNIPHEHHQIYLMWFQTFIADYPIDKIIYVNTPPSICHERISIRSRDGESNIPLEYLEKCHAYHNNMINKYSTNCVCQDQLVINGSENIGENNNLLEQWGDKIHEFINCQTSK
jgi:deoxyadenosine/deoxycytidine kinase